MTCVRTQTRIETRVSYPAYVTRTVGSFASSRPVSLCQPTTMISALSTKQITVPGSTVVVDLIDGGMTAVVVKEKTVEVVPDVRVVTKTDTLVSHVTNHAQESCPPNQGPNNWYPHGYGHDRDYDWDHDEYKWHKDQIDHSNHHHGPDEECYESDNSDIENQYKKEW
ncbi:hypothetical protein BDF21DRAFT_462580 [Thamnidium elegans]|nr:hypothetical protein BDF21DRAFT_462580 [Thamnidium elegans]